MSKSGRILGYFPHYYRAGEPGKLLGEVVHHLAGPLEEADTHLFRIQRAHRLNVAENPRDIVRLAAALGLTAFHFEDLLAPLDGPLETRPALAAQRLEQMRDRVRRIAQLHLQGLGTPWAILEAAAIFLNARIVADQPGDPLVWKMDADGFSHRATIAFPHLPGAPREQIVLHENPMLRQKVEPAERWPMNHWSVENRNAAAAEVILSIEGIGERTVLPSIFCPATQEGIVFYGVVPGGSTLLIDAAGGARLDGLAVDEWLISFHGGLADFSAQDTAVYALDEGQPAAPFDGDLERLLLPPFRQTQPIPAAPIGKTDWYFKVGDGIYDGCRLDYAVYATPAEPVGVFDGEPPFDGCVFDYPASAVVGMAWDGRVPCAFKLLLPQYIPAGEEDAAPSAAQAPNALSRVGSILPRFKAAGVRAYVDTARDGWILGAGVLRAPDAAQGEGVDFHTTRARGPHADRYITL